MASAAREDALADAAESDARTGARPSRILDWQAPSSTPPPRHAACAWVLDVEEIASGRGGGPPGLKRVMAAAQRGGLDHGPCPRRLGLGPLERRPARR